MPTRNDVEDFDLDDDPEEYADLEMDDDIYFEEEEEDSEDEDDYESLDFSNRYRNFSARRRIEIAREDKWLQSVVADFDDFDYIGDLEGEPDWKSAY